MDDQERVHAQGAGGNDDKCDLVEVVIACCNGQMGREAAMEVISELRLAGFAIVPVSSAKGKKTATRARHPSTICNCGGDPGQPSSDHDISCPAAISTPPHVRRAAE
jgi:hypothetical protein